MEYNFFMAIKKFKIEYKDPNDLIPYVKNSKSHPDDQINKIAGQISAFGFDQPVVINSQGVIIKGHGRTLASIKLGLTEIPVIIQTLDEYQEMAARIADNKVAESPWDNDMLKFDLGTLQNHEFDMQLTGFDDFDIKNMLEEKNFDSGLESDQGKLDEKLPLIVNCPSCSESFDANKNKA